MVRVLASVLFICASFIFLLASSCIDYCSFIISPKVLLRKVRPNFVFLFCFLLLKINSVFLGHLCF